LRIGAPKIVAYFLPLEFRWTAELDRFLMEVLSAKKGRALSDIDPWFDIV
jgi:hypothetical protein